MGADIILKVDHLIRKSLEYAFQYYPEISDYVKQHATEMNEDVMRKHIELYVNKFSLHLGSAGKAAVQHLFDVYTATKAMGSLSSRDLFIS